MVTGFDLIHSNKPLQKHWIRRFIGYVIDLLISSFMVYMIFYVLAVSLLDTSMLLYFPMTAGMVQVFYSAVLEYTNKKTLGKQIMNLRVEYLKHRFDMADALIRNISKLHGILVLLDWMIGMLSEGDPRQRYLDRLADTTIKAAGEPLHVRDFIEDHLFKEGPKEESPESGNIEEQDDKKTCRECGGTLKEIGDGRARCKRCGRIQ